MADPIPTEEQHLEAQDLEPDIIDDLTSALDGYGSLFAENATGRELERAHATWANTPPAVRDHIGKRLAFLTARASTAAAREAQLAAEATEELGDIVDQRLERIEKLVAALVDRADLALDYVTAPDDIPPHPEPIDVTGQSIVAKANTP